MNTAHLSQRSVSKDYQTTTPNRPIEVSVQWVKPLRKGLDGQWLVSINAMEDSCKFGVPFRTCNLSTGVSRMFPAGTSRYSEKLLIQFATHYFAGLEYSLKDTQNYTNVQDILTVAAKNNLFLAPI